MVRRIAITGPESSGKSTLAEKLALKLGGQLVPEYAREYLGALRRKYSRQDLQLIAKEQFARNHAEYNAQTVVCDTEMTVMKVWEEDKFGEVSNAIENLWIKDQYDVVFLCYREAWQKQDEKNQLKKLHNLKV